MFPNRRGKLYIEDEFGSSDKVYTTVLDQIDSELDIDDDEVYSIKKAVENDHNGCRGWTFTKWRY